MQYNSIPPPHKKTSEQPSLPSLHLRLPCGLLSDHQTDRRPDKETSSCTLSSPLTQASSSPQSGRQRMRESQQSTSCRSASTPTQETLSQMVFTRHCQILKSQMFLPHPVQSSSHPQRPTATSSSSPSLVLPFLLSPHKKLSHFSSVFDLMFLTCSPSLLATTSQLALLVMNISLPS